MYLELIRRNIKMNIKKSAIALLLTMVLTTGCSDLSAKESETALESSVETTETSNQVENEAIILIHTNDGSSIKESVLIEDEMTLLESMNQSFDLIEEGGFIESINGYAQVPDDNIWWVFTVNGEMITVGANEYILQDGDTVEWELASF